MLKSGSDFFKSAGKSYAEGKNIARDVHTKISTLLLHFDVAVVRC
jgi:hypothetical protein